MKQKRHLNEESKLLVLLHQPNLCNVTTPDQQKKLKEAVTYRCQKCGSYRVQPTAHRKEAIHYLCLDCGFKWQEPFGIFIKHQKKKQKHANKDLRGESTHPKAKERIDEEAEVEIVVKEEVSGKHEKTGANLSHLLIGCLIFLLGIGIIILEILYVSVWTIVWVWSIPLPLIYIGVSFIILGVIVATSSLTNAE